MIKSLENSRQEALPWLLAILGVLACLVILGSATTSAATKGPRSGNASIVPQAVATVPPTLEARINICHRTGSERNPIYKEITISRSALSAHLRHGDIYPVPTAGCAARGTPSPSPVPTGIPSPMPTRVTVLRSR
jgi:hypothetical protein